MDDPGGVHLGQRLAGLERDLARLVDRQGPLAIDQLAEVGPLEVLHHDVRNAAFFERAYIVHPSHVLAPDLRGDLRFAKEPLDGHLVAHGLGQEELDGHLLLEAQVHGGHDEAHAALAEDLLDPILAVDHRPRHRVEPGRRRGRPVPFAFGRRKHVGGVILASILVGRAKLREHPEILEGRRVSLGVTPRGDVLQQSPHDLAAAGLRKRIGEANRVGARELADLPVDV